MSDINVLTTNDIIAKFPNISRKTLYELLNIKGCPLIKGGRGKHYLVEQHAFEEWLKNRKK